MAADAGPLRRTGLHDERWELNLAGQHHRSNRGRGPALYVRALLEPPQNSPDDWSLGAISPDETRTLRFSDLGSLNTNYQLLLDYRDLAGRLYSSTIVIDRPGGRDEARYYDVKLFEGIAVTPLGDSEPYPGLTVVGTTPARKSLRDRLKRK